jgi:hypothetical protein
VVGKQSAFHGHTLCITNMATEASSGKKSAAADALLSSEEKAKREAEHGALWLFFVNGYSTFVVFLSYLISVGKTCEL